MAVFCLKIKRSENETRIKMCLRPGEAYYEGNILLREQNLYFTAKLHQLVILCHVN